MKDSCAANDAFVTELPSDECNLFWKFQTNSVTTIIIQNCCCKNRRKWCIKKYAFHACENANDFRLRYFFEICGEWNAFVDFIGWLLAQQTFETSICRFFISITLIRTCICGVCDDVGVVAVVGVDWLVAFDTGLALPSVSGPLLKGNLLFKWESAKYSENSMKIPVWQTSRWEIRFSRYCWTRRSCCNLCWSWCKHHWTSIRALWNEHKKEYIKKIPPLSMPFYIITFAFNDLFNYYRSTCFVMTFNMRKPFQFDSCLHSNVIHNLWSITYN